MKKLSTNDKVIHDQFSKYGKNAKEWMRKCILMLPHIEKNRIWEKKKFGSIYEYAAKIAGMSRNKVNEGLRILKKTEDMPEIRKIIEKKGLFAVKPVVSIATTETDKFWAKKATEMNKSTLETFVRDYRQEQAEESREHCNIPRPSDRPGAGSPTNNGLNKPKLFQKNETPEEKVQLSMKLDKEIADALKKIKGAGDWGEAMKKLLKFSEKEFEAERKELELAEKCFQEELQKEKPEAVMAKNHTVTTTIKKFITKRSKGKCEHPNCDKPGEHIHHIEPFALKKEHNPEKLIYLCKEHHQIVHLGYIDDSAIMHGLKQLPAEPTIKSWKQIKKLPSYDIKNSINDHIAEFRRYNIV